MTPSLTAELIRHLGNRAGGQDPVGLTSAQWAALRFFDRANRLTRTPSAFARFHGTTRGTASQTIRTLEMSGHLARGRDPRDRRRVVFELTQRGRDALARDPADALERALATLPPEQLDQLTAMVQALTAAVDVTGAEETGFGYCDHCAYRQGHRNHRCALTGEAITDAHRERLCAAFIPRSKPALD